jgi:outer membrane protein TolC
MRLPLVLAALLAAAATRAQTRTPVAPAQPSPSAAPSTPAAPPAAPALSPATPPAPEPALAALETVGFDEAVQRAFRRATSAAIAAEEIRRAEGLLTQARSGSLPSLVASAALTRLDAERVSAGRVVAPRDQQGANLTLSVPVFAPSRWYQWSHASDAVRVARASEQEVRRLVALTAARAYLAVVAQRRSVEVSQRAVATARAHLEFARQRRLGGVGNALDEARADQQLAVAEAQLEGGLSGLARAREALGVAAGADQPLDAAGEPDLRLGASAVEEAERQAEQDRADVRAARERAGAARRVAGDSWADWLPTVSAVGQPFYQHPSTLTTPETGWQAQLVASFPLFEGFARLGQRDERDALAAESAAQLEGAVRQARSEVRAAWSGVAHADAALGQSQRGAESARSALRIVETAWRAGATTSLDVIDAERTARDADSAAVIAEDAARQARLDLLAAAGKFP